jgi:2-methylaconitate cis-trans-isomerase PrpF
MTEKLFPTGCRQEHITISSIPGIASFNVRASLVDAASPFVFVDSSTMPIIWHEQDGDSAASLDIIEAIRREGAVKMSLARDIHSAGLVRGTPKIAILSPSKYLNDQASEGAVPDISVTSYSMGKVHPSFQVTGAVCLAAAVCVPGTVAADLASTNLFYYSPPDTPPEFSKEGPGLEVCPVDRRVTIAHSTGQISADVKVIRRSDGEVEVQSVSVSRTARRLFKGVVFVSL